MIGVIIVVIIVIGLIYYMYSGSSTSTAGTAAVASGPSYPATITNQNLWSPMTSANGYNCVPPNGPSLTPTYGCILDNKQNAFNLCSNDPVCQGVWETTPFPFGQGAAYDYKGPSPYLYMLANTTATVPNTSRVASFYQKS